MVKIMIFEKITTDGATKFYISGKEVDKDTYEKLINDDQFEKIGIVKQDFGFDPLEKEPVVHIIGNSDDITIDCVLEEDEVQNSEFGDVFIGIEEGVETIRSLEFEDAVEEMKMYLDRAICFAQELAYDDIAKIAAEKRLYRIIQREQIDEE